MKFIAFATVYLLHFDVVVKVASETLVTIPLIPHRLQQARRSNKNVRNLDEETNDLHQNEEQEEQHIQVDTLYQGYGTHYVDLWCGTPPQRQTVIVDTGSATAAFPCRDCEQCGAAPAYHTDVLFDESASSTFNSVACSSTKDCQSQIGACKRTTTTNQDRHCKMHQGYAEGSSWTAFEARDHCYLGGLHDFPLVAHVGSSSPAEKLPLLFDDAWDPTNAAEESFEIENFLFGCQTELTGMFYDQLVDGILGMNASPDSYWQQLRHAGKLSSQAFSLCYSHPALTERDGTEAGGLTLGGTDPRWHDTPMQYSNMHMKKNWFGVKVRRVLLQEGTGSSSTPATINAVDLKVDGEILNRGGVIVDSGTTVTYWDHGVKKAFQDVFSKMTGRHYTKYSKWDLTLRELRDLPTIVFQLEGAKDAQQPGDDNKASIHFDPQNPSDVFVAFPPEHYMEATHKNVDANGQTTYRPGFLMDEYSGKGSILGANLMVGHDILFDYDNQRIGWAESSCNYTRFATKDFRTGEQYQRVAAEPSDNTFPQNTKSTPADYSKTIITGTLLLVAAVGFVVTRRHQSSTQYQIYNGSLRVEQSEEEVELVVRNGDSEMSLPQPEFEGDFE